MRRTGRWPDALGLEPGTGMNACLWVNAMSRTKVWRSTTGPGRRGGARPFNEAAYCLGAGPGGADTPDDCLGFKKPLRMK